MLISRTPYRLSFYGGGLDYPQWYENNEAKVLCAGLDYYCYLTVRELPPFFNHKYRACYSQVETKNKLEEIQHPSVREVLRKYGDGKSIEISHVGDLPAKSGIGSSSAFTVGLISSLRALNGEFMGRSALAKAAIKLEQNEMKENVGFQDQCASSFGNLVLIEAGKQGIQPRKFISRLDYINYITSSLLLGFDGNERFSSVASAEITKRIRSNTADDLMKELAQISNLGIDSFGKEVDIKEHALITKQSRDIKLEINGDKQNTRAVDLIEATEAAGSLCTRFMGAGGGGFFICWAPKNRHEAIKKSVNIKTWVDARVSPVGSQIIFSEE
tara:strand:- start:6664 stop:7650 length:987 start_codon:yes stop_codon:yes gene_type:complete